MRRAKLVSVLIVSYSAACGEGAPPEEYLDAVTADPAHYAVEFENDAVRLLRITYGPGERSVMHTHPASCAVALGDASWRMTDPEGAVTENSETHGQVQCFDATVHQPENVGDGPAELILVEFQEGATPGMATSEYPDAVTADPAHYSVEFENDVARLLRIRYGVGETSAMHYHPANCAIFLNEQNVSFELASGEVVEAESAPGQVLCSDAEVHLPTNVGEGPIELVLVELKGRETLTD